MRSEPQLHQFDDGDIACEFVLTHTTDHYQTGNWELQYYNVSLWGYWDEIRCPVLTLRGAWSDLLLSDTAEEMAARGPKAEVVEIEGCGHAPALMDAEQIGLVADWLRRTG